MHFVRHNFCSVQEYTGQSTSSNIFHPLARVPHYPSKKNRALDQRRPRPYHRGQLPAPRRKLTAARSEMLGASRPDKGESILHLPRTASRSSDGGGHGDGDVMQATSEGRFECAGSENAQVSRTHCH